MVTGLESGAVTWARGGVGDVHLGVVFSKVPMACENLGKTGGEFTLGGLEICVGFFLSSL